MAPVPEYGSARLAARTSAAEELTQDAPAGEVLGTVSRARVERAAEGYGPPPWESDPEHHDSDGRKFVLAPADIALRWMNPARVSQAGLRHWQAVAARGDSRFVVRKGHEYMIAPDNTVRRGDHRGDFLAWMPLAWVASNQQRKLEVAARARASSVTRQQSLKEELRRGGFGPYVQAVEATHPTHTAAEGRSMGKD